jgi:hypothetical protein
VTRPPPPPADALASRSRRRGAARAAVLAAVAAAALLARGLGAASADPGRGSDAAVFERVVAAWQERRAAAVTARVPSDGRLRLDLLGTGDGRVEGRPTPAQAEAVLDEYFGRLDSAALRAVTPTGHRRTRTFDYTYRPTGGVERTTRLTFTLTPLRDGGYGLAAVVERAKRAP